MEQKDSSSCKICGQDAVYHTLTRTYDNENFCDQCYKKFIDTHSHSYIMVINTKNNEIIDHRSNRKSEGECKNIPDQPAEVERIYREINKYLR